MPLRHCPNCRTMSIASCTIHTLQWGIVKELTLAVERGWHWGNIVYNQEQEALAAETPEQTAARAEKVIQATENTAERLKAYEIQKKTLINTDTKTGAIKRCSGRPCRDAEEPAKWVVGKKRLGNYKEWASADPKATKKPSSRPAGVPPDAIFWGYGCEHHAAGCCEHLHPGQPGYEDAKAGKKPHVEALVRNAVFLSNKPTPRTPDTARTSPVMLDAW